MFLPNVHHDRSLSGKRFEMPPFPNPGSADPALYGRPRVKFEHLTGREPVKGEKVAIIVAFDGITDSSAASA